MRGQTEKADHLEGPQLIVLRFIRDYIKKNRIAPTYEEIMAKTGAAKTPVRRTIDRLIAKGLLGRGLGIHRNLYVTKTGQAAAKDGRKRRRTK